MISVISCCKLDSISSIGEDALSGYTHTPQSI